MRTAAELNHERPQHERWVALSVEAGQMAPHRCLRDLRVLHERDVVMGERRPDRDALARRWSVSVRAARSVVTQHRLELDHQAAERVQEQRIAAALVARRARAEAQRIEREARAVQAADRARVEQVARAAEALRRSLDRLHDAWLVEVRTRGPLTEQEALVDLGVLRWRGSVPGPTALGARWGWRPRSEVVPFLNRAPASHLPDFAHVEVAGG